MNPQEAHGQYGFDPYCELGANPHRCVDDSLQPGTCIACPRCACDEALGKVKELIGVLKDISPRLATAEFRQSARELHRILNHYLPPEQQ